MENPAPIAVVLLVPLGLLSLATVDGLQLAVIGAAFVSGFAVGRYYPVRQSRGGHSE